MSDYLHIGNLVATFGVQGQLLLKHVLGKKADFKSGDVIYLEEHAGSMLPYFIELSVDRNESETILQVEGLKTKESAMPLLKKKAWLTEKDFKKHVHNAAPVFLIGFTVVSDGKAIGKVQEVIEQPHQVLLSVEINEKEVLIPLHEATLKNINRKKKEILVSLPEGLLDVYL